MAPRGRRFKSCPRYKCDVSGHRRHPDLRLQVRVLVISGVCWGLRVLPSQRGLRGLRVLTPGVEQQGLGELVVRADLEAFGDGIHGDARDEVVDQLCGLAVARVAAAVERV